MGEIIWFLGKVDWEGIKHDMLINMQIKFDHAR